MPVNSLYRIFFFSLGSVCLLIVPLFWLALAFEYSALENFILRLTKTQFVGYPIPEIIGASFDEGFEQNAQRIKMAFSIMLASYALLLIAVSYLDRVGMMLRILSAGIFLPLFATLVYFWITFNMDDHVISKTEKSELFQFTVYALFLSVFLFWFAFRKRPHGKKLAVPNSPRQLVPEVSVSKAESSDPEEPESLNETTQSESSPEGEENLNPTSVTEENDENTSLAAEDSPEDPGSPEIEIQSEPEIEEATSNQGEVLEEDSGEEDEPSELEEEHAVASNQSTSKEPSSHDADEPQSFPEDETDHMKTDDSMKENQEMETNLSISADDESEELEPVQVSAGETEPQASTDEIK